MKRVLICVATSLLLFGCIKQDSPPVVENDPVVQLTEFEQKDIVSIRWNLIDEGLETSNPLYLVEFTNSADFPIHKVYASLGLGGNWYGNLDYQSVIPPMTTATMLYTQRNMEKVEMIDYTYFHDNLSTELVYKSEQINEYTLDYAVERPKGMVPLIPNTGMTIYTWKDNGIWRFNYLLGREAKESTYIGDHSTSLVEAFTKETNEQMYYYIKTKATNKQAIKDYVKRQMELIENYKQFTYVLEGEEDQFPALDQKFAYRRSLLVYEKGTTKCEFEFCVQSYYETQNPYTFTKEQRASIAKMSLSMDEIVTVMKQYPSLHPYVLGRDKKLTLAQAVDVGTLFRETQTYPQVENEPMGADKPIIYLYPEKETQIQVILDYNGKLNTTYPTYNNGWNVIAKPDGTIYNLADHREYSYLFWEGKGPVSYELNQGFVVKREDTVAFLQESLEFMGLLPKEYNEFIVYWLPILEEHVYNLIAFQGKAYTDAAKLNIMPKPDSMLRIFMTFQELKVPMYVEPQVLEPFVRHGFAVIEWGGVELK